MKIRKSIATLAIAAMAFWAPSIIPVKAGLARCGVELGQYRTMDTAFAEPFRFFPCPTPHGPSPWPVVAVFAGTISVMLNAAIVWQTQCRELTSAEAMSSTFLPLVGIAFDAQASKCGH